ncbi:MAG TPA: hypothetical protein VEG38_14890, partial [Acidimicrobiia bacterium]|nr:hypothetical protein [Acidimicrobiia bacterium]
MAETDLPGGDPRIPGRDENREHGDPADRAEQGSWEPRRAAPAPAPTRTRKPAGGRRPLTPMAKGDPWSLGGPLPGGPTVVALG